MASKKIHNNDITGGRGVNLIERVVLEMGCLWYPTGGVEAGIDGIIEIRDAASGEVTNSVVQVQSKATAGRFTAETDTSFEYLCEEKDLDYWLNGNAPVILVRSRPDTGEAYWASIKDRFRDLDAKKSRKIYFDKNRDRFDANARADIVRLAIPRDSGIYLAPPPKSERLYSNLLGLSRFPERIFVAQTDVRYPSQMWEALREVTDRPNGEWLLANKSLISFHDLSGDPWRHVCERGSIESFDSDEFAFSEDDGMASTFLNLLYLSLKERLWQDDVKYDPSFGYYYFKATPDLTERKLTYQSLEQRTSRTVFGPYMSKKDPDKVKYYRHSAFGGFLRRFDEGWYLEINPTYRYTVDGVKVYRFYEDLLKGMKRLENNQAILGQIAMWANLLSRPTGMFDEIPTLTFGELKTFKVDAGIMDAAWLKQEEKPKDEEAEGLSRDEEQLSLFTT